MVAKKKTTKAESPRYSCRTPPLPEDWLIARCWEGPYTLSQAAKRLRDHGYGTDKLVREWRRLFRKHGSRLYPKPAPPRTYTKAELEQPMFGSEKYGVRTYGDWLGTTGPGALLRQLLKAEA